MKIISISGLDGSGKSTQIEMLKSYLASQGKKVFYFHAIQFGLANKINDFFSGHSERSEESRQIKTGNTNTGSFASAQDDIQKSVTRANWFQIQLRKIAFGIDLCRFGKLLKKLEKQNYDYLISDRYFYDTVINIKYLAKNEKTLPCEKFIKKPDVAIYLKTEPVVIMQRERKPDQGIEYLAKKKDLLDQAAYLWNLKVIDGNRNKEEVFEEILNNLVNYFLKS